MKLHLLAIIVLLFSASAFAQSTRPDVKLSTTVEEGKKSIIATVTLNGKPVEGAVVQFMVRRTFGNLIIGTDTTLDDGTAATAFPNDLPADYDHNLQVIAMIKTPEQYAFIYDQAKLNGGLPLDIPAEPFPRALWAPYAPLWLLLTIGILLAGVWTTYVFVISQIVLIKKGAVR